MGKAAGKDSLSSQGSGLGKLKDFGSVSAPCQKSMEGSLITSSGSSSDSSLEGDEDEIQTEGNESAW